jgi:ribosomal protein S27E
MPYLHCPRCHRTAWVRSGRDGKVECRQCGTTLSLMPGSEAQYLAGAVRARFAREARDGTERARFIRDPQQLRD